MIDKTDIHQLQQIIFEEYDRKLSEEETNMLGLRLIRLFETVISTDQNQNKNQNYATPNS